MLLNAPTLAPSHRHWAALWLALASPFWLSPAWGWGHAGHQVIGSLADELLVGTPAAKKVAALLGPGVNNLQTAAVWLDCTRDVEFRLPDSYLYKANPKFPTKACAPFLVGGELNRMQDFARRNWHNCPAGGASPASPASVASPPDAAGSGGLACHRSYHFTDVAVQRAEYSRQHVGTNSHDIVATLQAAIAVLRNGPPAVAPFKIKDRKEALLLIAHLVGDLHQPLHVGAVYLHDDGSVVDPDAGSPPVPDVHDTRGGNSLEIGDSDLHAAWDTIPSSITLTGLASGPGQKRRQALLAAARAVPATPGAPAMLGSWPEAWASDTVVAAPAAFAGLGFSRSGAIDPRHWAVQFSDRAGYDAAREALQRRQVSVAAARLAQLLRAVWP